MAGASGFMALLAKPKGSVEEPDEEEAPSGEGGSARKLAALAVQAIRDGDDDAATDALVGAIRACMSEEDDAEPTSKY